MFSTFSNGDWRGDRGEKHVGGALTENLWDKVIGQ